MITAERENATNRNHSPALDRPSHRGGCDLALVDVADEQVGWVTSMSVEALLRSFEAPSASSALSVI
jgi:hypothetical protein